ncbi:MAG: LPS export ABC transporter permease LptF [Nitrospinae bacterium RIFCSPLOWO2_12_39_16]|nr:MAG: LPS export ABC transporter permease LptF [Nitrospinae bacterium RIFCSPLOWO2_12_39_16]HLA48779.1 LPS export ABC transporter permease LptF [Nitrospinota bacterium]
MKILDRYILKELVKFFILSVFILTLVLFLDQLHFLSEMILNRGVAVRDMLLLILYISPAFLALTIPLSVLFASLMTFSRLSGDNEIIAVRAAGISMYRLMLPVLILCTFTYLASGYIMLYLQHRGNYAFKNFILQVSMRKANFEIKERVFNNDFKDLIIYVEEREIGSSVMKGIFIYDSQQNSEPQVITAREGRFVADPETMKILLQLKDGTINRMVDKMNRYQLLTFDTYDILVDMGKGEGKYTIAKEPREMSVRELKKRMAGLRQEKKETFIEEVEIQTKYSLPFACFVFGLFGAPLGIKVHRSGKRGGLGIGLIIVIADYIFLLAGQALGREGRVSPVIALWLPNILIGGLGIYLLNRISKEAMPFEFMMKLSEFIEKVRR